VTIAQGTAQQCAANTDWHGLTPSHPLASAAKGLAPGHALEHLSAPSSAHSFVQKFSQELAHVGHRLEEDQRVAWKSNLHTPHIL